MRQVSPSWGLPGHTMGVVIGQKVPRETAFVFFQNVVRTLGYEPDEALFRSLKKRTILTRALARVIAHEVVHALLPDRDHDMAGLMCAHLGRSHLMRQGLDPEPATARAIASAVASILERRSAEMHATPG